MTSPESRGFRKKSKEELEEQVRKSGEDLGVEISPPSHGEDIYGMSEAELKAKYPKRHELYLRSLRPENAGLSDEEQEKEAVERKKSATMIEALNHLDRFIALEKAKEGRDPRETRQLKVFEDLRDFLEQGGTQGYIKLPTGAGKTVVFTKVLDAMDIRTLIVVPGKELVEQTEKSIARFAPKKEVGKVYSGKKKGIRKKGDCNDVSIAPVAGQCGQALTRRFSTGHP